MTILLVESGHVKERIQTGGEKGTLTLLSIRTRLCESCGGKKMTKAKPGGYNFRRQIKRAELSHEVIRQELTKIMVGANPSQVSAIARANMALAGGMSAVNELSKIRPTGQRPFQ